MALLGNIIKSAIKIADKVTSKDDPPEVQQVQQLISLLEKASSTVIGSDYNFTDILKSENIRETFATTLPYFDYEDIYGVYWERVVDGYEGISWPGKVHYFARSSGTTGNAPKYIPVTDDMIDSIRQAGIKQLLSLSHFDIPAEVYEKEVLMLGSSTDLKKVDDHLEGEISGISASNIPSWFEGVYRPGKEIASIDNWDERVHAIAKAAPDWDIGALSGIPSWIQLMLKYIIDYHKLTNIHEIWPNLSLYTTGGVSFEPYRKSFEALLERPLIYLDTYLASEGFFAFNARPETKAMQLILDHGVYFEFVPFDDKHVGEDGKPLPNARPILIENVQTDQDYAMIISTCAGAWRYLIGDTIQFTDIEKKEIIITGRTKFFLNAVGSQMSVDKMIDGITQLEESFDIQIKEFTVAAVELENGWEHHWYLGTNNELKEEELAQKLDALLQESTKGYRVARTKALKHIRVKAIPPQLVYDYQELQKQKGGQAKFPRVLKDDQLSSWKSFLKEHS